MAGGRRFTRLGAAAAERPGTFPVPEDGMCLSAYLVLHPRQAPREVLLGRMDPSGPWGEVACLDEARVRAIGDRWVLPATQLLFFEGPDEAARRIARELLELRELEPGPPTVFSEAYSRPTGSPDPHWDLHFVYSAPWPEGAGTPQRGKLWRELRFVDVGTTRTREFGRGHADVLALMGLAPRADPAE